MYVWIEMFRLRSQIFKSHQTRSVPVLSAMDHSSTQACDKRIYVASIPNHLKLLEYSVRSTEIQICNNNNML